MQDRAEITVIKFGKIGETLKLVLERRRNEVQVAWRLSMPGRRPIEKTYKLVHERNDSMRNVHPITGNLLPQGGRGLLIGNDRLDLPRLSDVAKVMADHFMGYYLSPDLPATPDAPKQFEPLYGDRAGDICKLDCSEGARQEFWRNLYEEFQRLNLAGRSR